MFSYTLSSALRFALTRGYATENRPQADVLEVNQSPEKKKKKTRLLLPLSLTLLFLNCFTLSLFLSISVWLKRKKSAQSMNYNAKSISFMLSATLQLSDWALEQCHGFTSSWSLRFSFRRASTVLFSTKL